MSNPLTSPSHWPAHADEHHNEVTRWWLANVADIRKHGTTKQTPLELHADEQSHLLSLPGLAFDTAQVVYRVVDTDGTIRYANNRYSVPWRLVGESLPVRITDEHLIAYDRSLSEVARHVMFQGLSGQCRVDQLHTPPRDHEEQMQRLRERFAELGEIGTVYLKGLESKQRNSKHQALKVLGLLHAYHKSDVVQAMDRGVRYYAFGFSSLERILAHQATPKPSWQQLDESSQETLKRLTECEPVEPRHSQEYNETLNGSSRETADSDERIQEDDSREPVNGDHSNAPSVDPAASSNAEDSSQ